MQPADRSNQIGMRQRPPALGSLVLAGGASARMGFDKAKLRYDGEPQVRRIARTLESLAPPAWVSVRRAQAGDEVFAGLRVILDEDEGIGPMAGVLGAFRQDPNRAWLVVAVDMPFLTGGVLRRLVESRDPALYGTAYRNSDGGPETVCAIYEPRILPVLLERKAKGKHSLMVLRDVPVKMVDPVDPRELRNINTFDDYREASRQRAT